MTYFEGTWWPADEQRPREHQGCAAGCIVLTALPVLAVAVLFVGTALQNREQRADAVAEADALAARFAGLAGRLDYAHGVPEAGLKALSDKSNEYELLSVTPGEGRAVEVGLRVEVGLAQAPAPMAGNLTRCYRVRLGEPGPVPVPRSVDC
ncbi:hypothetical protein ACIRBX_09825 [Kitasatospora sp. NPDC096147]|uniref:hypothetical protein n=1 Tax=Kitasatospora sp. NPDC096147 TaxID=3364093 RepID=UPI0037FFF2FA